MRKVHHLVQGSPEWKAHRATPGMFNGSEIAAIMGIDPKTSRSELLRMKALGGEKEFSDYVQKNVIDKGHEYEAIARPQAEELIGDDLSPLVITNTVDGLLLSVSLDGITQGYDTTFEHKSLNITLADALDAGCLPDEYHPQCEAGLMVSGATRCLFMASKDGDMATARHYWYESKPELRPRIIAACRQFAEDLANYQHVEQTVAAVAAPIESLPAVAVTVTGSISLTHNLERFGQRLTGFVAGLNSKPETDQDFADLDAAVKVLKEAESALDAAEKNALAQTTAIADMCNLVEMYRKMARENRLMFENIVKAEKENRRAEIVTTAQNALHKHYEALNARIGGGWMPPLNAVQFAEAVKGLKSLDSMRDKVSTTLANAKIKANEIADRIEANRKMLVVDGRDWIDLFPDFAGVCTGGTDLFGLVVKDRIDRHNERIEAEREKIRQEEAAKLTAQNQTQYEDQRGKANAGITTPACEQTTAAPDAGIMPVELPAGNAASAASTPPTQTFTSERVGEVVNESMIDDYIRLLGISAAEKKALRGHLVKFESYRIKMAAARGLAAAA